MLAVGLLAFIVFFERRTTSTSRTQLNTSLLWPELQTNAMTRVEIIQGTNLVLRGERIGPAWRLRAPVDYPGQSLAFDNLVSSLAQMRYRSAVSSKEMLSHTNGPAAFGLNPPLWTLVLLSEAQRVELRLGGRTLIGEQVYAQVVGRDGLFVIDAASLPALPLHANQWRETSLLSFPVASVDRVEVRPSTNGFVVLQDPTNKVWQMSKPLLTRANAARIDHLLRAMEMARVNRFVSDDSKADLEGYGLFPPDRELVLGQGTNDLLVLQIGRLSTQEVSQVYVRSLTHSNVVQLAAAVVEPWLASFREFCDRRMLIFPSESVDRIEVSADEKYVLQKGTNQVWQVLEPVLMEADSVLVTELIGNLAELEFQEFEKEVATDFAPYGLAPPKRRYALYSTLSANLSSTNLLLAQMDLGNPNGSKFYARRGQENSIVTTMDPGRLPKAAFELRSRQIWSIPTNRIASITIRQDGGIRKLIRTGPMKWVHSSDSQGMINHFTLEEAAYRLGQLRAERWVAKGEASLARFGIPATQHELTIDLVSTNTPLQATIRFGRKSTGGRAYAAVTLPGESQPVVFVCPQSIYQYVESDLVVQPPPGN